MGRVVLEADRQLVVAERDPAALAAPLAVDELLLERQQRSQRVPSFGCGGLPASAKVQVAHADRKLAHICGRLAEGNNGWLINRLSRLTSWMPKAACPLKAYACPVPISN